MGIVNRMLFAMGDPAAENVVIMTALLSVREAEWIFRTVKGNDFFEPLLARVFDRAKSLWAAGGSHDVAAVHRSLKREGLLGDAEEAFLKSVAPLPPDTDVVYWARVLIEESRRRRLRLPVVDWLNGSDKPPCEKLLVELEDIVRRARERDDDDVTLDEFIAVEQALPDVSWLWPGWLPRGLVTVLAAAPGEGKSALALEIARRVAASSSSSFVGGDLCVPPASSSSCSSASAAASSCVVPPASPNGEQGPHMGGPLQREEEKAVVWVDTEASEAILRQRVSEWKVPKDRLRVFASKGPAGGMATLSLDDALDWRRIESGVMRARPALVVVDSLSGGHALDENSSEMRHLLLKLARLARDSQAAVLVVHHLRKKSALEPDAVTLDRVRGSGTIAQLARCIWVIDRPAPGDPRRRLVQVKNNLMPFPEPVGFLITAAGVQFAPAPRGRAETLAERAGEFLGMVLADGPVPARDIRRQATDYGFSLSTTWRAAERLGVTKTRQGRGPWHWGLPPAAAPSTIQGPPPVNSMNSVNPLPDSPNLAGL